MFTVLVVIHLIVCLGLIIVVLMQSSKGDGLASAFGGGAFSGAVFGGRGASTFLSKASWVLAILFMVTCIGLTLSSRGGVTTSTPESAVERVVGEERQQMPTTTPAQQPTQQPTQTPPAGGGQ
ncbi:MAG: preprotein translocase subunit SecG [candidate division Zixibacteria bacterium]|nr:preprotein translocase subunit SecG [candidate division Zixibacteria bacterium]